MFLLEAFASTMNESVIELRITESLRQKAAVCTENLLRILEGARMHKFSTNVAHLAHPPASEIGQNRKINDNNFLLPI